MKITDLSINNVSCYEFAQRKRIFISWSANMGSGELTLYRENGSNKWKANTKGMCKGEDKDFVRMVLNKWVDGMEIEE